VDEELGMPHAIVVGAGMSGTCAARSLVEAGWSVTVLDKGRRHGGRLATRTVDDAVFDTGALDFAISEDAEVTALVDAWRTQGLVTAATGAGPVDPSGPAGRDHAEAAPPRPRWRGTPTMRSLPTALAADLDVRLGTTVNGLLAARSTGGASWQVTAQDRSGAVELHADALVLTPPVPQVLALVGADGTGAARPDPLIEARTEAALRTVAYAPSLTVLTVPTRTTATTRTDAASDLARVHDDRASGASPVTAFTLQGTARFSAMHLDGDRDAAAAVLARQASVLLGTALEVVHVHGWRYAQITSGIDAPALRDDTSGAPMVIAGDAFGGSEARTTEGVERAVRSGLAAAALLVG
jgi:renalase